MLLAVSTFLRAAPPSGAVIGLITSSSGAALSHLHVVLVEIATGVRHEGSTDARGFFSFCLLAAGEYQLESLNGHFVPAGASMLVLSQDEKRSWRLVWERESLRGVN
jgi:hypothetical protein